MKKATIILNAKLDFAAMDMEYQEHALQEIVEKITNGFISGEIMLEPVDKSLAYVPFWWTLKESNE